MTIQMPWRHYRPCNTLACHIESRGRPLCNLGQYIGDTVLPEEGVVRPKLHGVVTDQKDFLPF